jgi:antitoxin component HigA of HigAB toxin-antitoxin module
MPAFRKNAGMGELDWILQGLEKPGKTRSGLAAALGKAPSAVTDLLQGKRQLKASEIKTVASYLEVAAPSFFGTTRVTAP